MASPQKEHGYTQIANEILDAICHYHFNGSQLRIIMKIWRETYGWKRRDHALAVTYLIGATGLSDRTIKKELTALINSNVLIVTKEATNIDARKLAFNKNYEEWNIPRSDDFMEKEFSFGVNDPSPQDTKLEVKDTSPLEVNNTSPLNTENRGLEVKDTSPNKEIRSLKKSFKEKENMFDQFFSLYPRRVAKAYAQKIWLKHCKDDSFDPDLVLSNTKHYAATCTLLKTKSNFIPHPSTYLNQKRYEDYPTVDPEGLAAGDETKLDSNLDFFREQLGSDQAGPNSNSLTDGKSIGSLPQ